MTIKEKLINLGIDVDKEKDFIKEVKDFLNKNGEKADKITSKLSYDGEKLLDTFVRESGKIVVPKKSVKRPSTLKVNTTNDSNKELKDNKSDTVKDVKSNISINTTNPNEDLKNSGNDWGKIDPSKISLTIKGKTQVKNVNGAPNGRPLPQSTLDEIRRKKEEEELKLKDEKEKIENETNDQVSNVELNTNVANTEAKIDVENQNAEVKEIKTENKNQNNQLKNNTQNNKNDNKNKFSFNKNNINIKNNQGKKDFVKKPNQNNQGNNKNQNQNKPKGPNLGGKTVRVSLNTTNANLVTGTNNRFEGKKKDKDKYNHEKTNKNNQGKLGKDKAHKYKTTVNNYDDEQVVVRKAKKTGAGAFIKPVVVDVKPQDDIKSIVVGEYISIKDLASKLKLQPAVIVKKLFMSGQMVTPNTELSYEEAENIALEYDILCEKEQKVDVIGELLKEEEENEANLVNRPPVVCVMGHVDHGKTSILDAIRNTNVIEREAGGITQHIGAYQVEINNRLITFLDTPGHEAFTAMRLRGAKSTDIAVLVVAADDGVKPQTIEAINHARAANVEIVVAVNKIDKEDANVERVKQQLAEYELVSTDWGGSTTFCEVSAKKNIGIKELLEMILLTADVMDLKANPNRLARGIVIESLLDKGKGPVARILVQKGTLHSGDFIAMGASFGKVRAMIDFNGKHLKEALPSTPVEILGLNNVPQAGDTFMCFKTDKEARAFAETFVNENKQKMVEDSKQHNLTLDSIFEKIKNGELKELPIVLKADVVGSSEAIKNSLEKLSNDEVKVSVIHEGVGNVNESDVTLASAAHAIIIAFNVKVEGNAKAIIDREQVDIRNYNIIYNAIDDVEKAMKGMLKPVFEEKVIGHLTIRQVFKSSNVGNIAGCYVDDGEVRRNCKIRLNRNDKLIFEGDLLSLKRFKDEVKEVKTGFECGIVLDGFSDYEPNDTMESYVLEEKKII